MEPRLQILAIEPYLALSHRLFLEGLQQHSIHDWTIAALPARKWKWRMRTSALHFLEVVESADWDLLFVSDFLNLQELQALLSERARRIPVVLYFHENQLTYLLQEQEKRDYHFGLTHFYSMLGAQRSLFNSDYHRREFLEELPRLLKRIPDVDTGPFLERVIERCGVMPLGTDVPRRDRRFDPVAVPTILWSHRWEYDKDPRSFVDALYALDRQGLEFRVRVLGEQFRVAPPEFAELQQRLPERLDQVGFIADRDEYLDAVASADIFVSTARHEFFGLAALEAIRCGLLPVLPDDLAYPELTRVGAAPSPFLYRREDGLAGALADAIEMVQAGQGRRERSELLHVSDRYEWSQLAPRYDALCEEIARAR